MAIVKMKKIRLLVNPLPARGTPARANAFRLCLYVSEPECDYTEQGYSGMYNPGDRKLPSFVRDK
jgi:hypothetical protein